jgi:hypothetical protein
MTSNTVDILTIVANILEAMGFPKIFSEHPLATILLVLTTFVFILLFWGQIDKLSPLVWGFAIVIVILPFLLMLGPKHPSTPNCPSIETDEVAQSFDSCLDALQILGSKKNGIKPLSGVYNIKFGAHGHVPLFCDMDWKGGGWTVLISDMPVGSGAFLAPGLTVQSVEPFLNPLTGQLSSDAHWWNSCGHNIQQSKKKDGYWSCSCYICGNYFLQSDIKWENWLNAKELAFGGVLQGHDLARLTVNGAVFKEFHRKNDCSFYVSSKSTPNHLEAAAVGVNLCHRTDLSQFEPVVINVAPLNPVIINIETGKACQPDCKHGSGWKIHRMMVR